MDGGSDPGQVVQHRHDHDLLRPSASPSRRPTCGRSDWANALTSDSPGNRRASWKPHQEWQGTERVTVSYGQGVSSTAIQLISGGEHVGQRRHVCGAEAGALDDRRPGNMQPTAPSATHRVVSEDVAATMNVLMRDVVCAGTASQAKIPGYTIAGKTGTGYKAQKNGTYWDENGHRSYYASFVGFFPAENPQVTVLVSIDEPPAGGAHFGGNTAAPAFARIAKAAIHELAIAPPTADGGCPS
ncbi:MAG: penicillin-binding transpeptidase domain-containing protein [Ilumatobacteraceae bacterium]